MAKDKAYEELLWKRIEEHIPKISKKEARFRQVDKIPSLGAFMKSYENDCADCLLYRKEIERVVANIPDILKYKGAELEREMEVWKTHLREKHGVYPDFYFNYRYATYSFGGGFLLGILLSYLFYNDFRFSTIGLITSACLIVGAVYGMQQDGKVKREGKNY